MGHTNKVTSVTFAPDGKTLASSSYDQTIKLWNCPADKNCACSPYVRIMPMELHLVRTERRFTRRRSDETVKLWQTASGKELLTRRAFELCQFRCL